MPGNRRRTLLVSALVVLGLVAALGIALLVVPRPAVATADSALGSYAPEKQFTERITESFLLPMRDGTRLAVKLDRPAVDGRAAPGPFPVLWQHSLSTERKPEDGAGPKTGGIQTIPTLTDHGYVVAQVARRGNGQSFGVRRGYNDRLEAGDAYEVTEWLAAQPWSDGNVGVYGCSNTGDAAMHTLTVRPPHLKAVLAGCFSWDKYDAWRVGGISAQWGFGPSRTVEQDLANTPVDGDEDKTLLREAAVEHQKATPLADMWRGMPYRDSWTSATQSRFWSEGSVGSYADQVRAADVPVYVIGGWHDELRGQGIATLLNVPGSRLLVGPWKHCENAGFGLVEEAHRFFDQHLKGIDTGIDAEPPIHYATPRSDAADATGLEWTAAQSWPPTGTGPQPTTLGGDGVLGSAAPGARGFTVDTAAECPTDPGSGSTIQPCHIPGSGTSWTGPVLDAATELTGTPVADLTVRTDRRDGDVFAYLEEVAPDGRTTVITEGRQRISLRAEHPAPYTLPEGVPWHRAYAADAAPVTPGGAVRLRFAMLPTSYEVPAGHRIRVTVTGHDPRATGPLPDADGARIEVLSGPDTASSVTLPHHTG
ncbi:MULTISPECIES: CocE/NonD family hydrolase [unclassified Pseudonocardia]|uniref:CocE/NonD family hydrolase n=1 Tax=unclassified Pseudonocardia TaxID=2619320 RepID=UPI0001FFEB32|nr:CocE/NonD family hydrolase [Pseudonocardia sp. Ae707_Ps1]OLM18909.1 Cocaine esterase [Pseudonocardia sp. Ae707_Ps1]